MARSPASRTQQRPRQGHAGHPGILRDLDSRSTSRKQACRLIQQRNSSRRGCRWQGLRDVADPGRQPRAACQPRAPPAASRAPGAEATQTDLSQQIKETAEEWARSARTRNAVTEGASEEIIEKYRKYVEDYYKGVAVKGTEQQ
jgi:hypothetical protein